MADLREKGKINDRFAESKYGFQSWVELHTIIDDDTPHEDRLEALKPDRIALAMAALGVLELEARQLERQWSLKRERARHEAERARRQYDAVEPRESFSSAIARTPMGGEASTSRGD